MVDLYTSNSFAEGFMTFYLNRQLKSKAVKYMSARISIWTEAGMPGQFSKENLKSSLADKSSLNYGWTAMKCFDMMDDDEMI